MDPEDIKHNNWPQATVILRDALRSYIRISEENRRRLIELRSPTDIKEPHLDRCRALLKEIEEIEVDPWLNDNRGPPEDLRDDTGPQ